MNLFKKVSSFGISTLISRILGYIRDILFAFYLGASQVSDALFVAFRIPNTFRSLFLEGSFNSAFVPIYKKQKEKKKFANNIFNILVIFLLLIIFLIEIFTTQFLYIIAPGFSQDEEKFKLLIELSRITFPFLLFISLASFFSAILNSHEKFFIPASAPIILNLILIISLILFHSSATEVAYASAISLTFAGIIQSIFLLYFARKYFTPIIKFTFKFTFQIKLFFLRLFPSVFASGVNQINILVGTIIASFESGAVSYLYYADRIYQLPLALSGIAIATIILPRLSNSIVKSKKNEIYFIQNRSLELCLFLTLPATVGILIASEEIISALYGYGSFTSDNINVTAKALILFGTGLPAFALIKIYSSFYFARGNTKTPFYFSTFSVLINVSVSLYYFDDYGFLIIPFSTSLASWLTVVLYQSNLSLNNYSKFDNLFFSKILKSLTCSGLMGLLLYFMVRYFSDVLNSASYLKPLTLVTVVFLSASIYFFTAYFIKAFRIKDLKL